MGKRSEFPPEAPTNKLQRTPFQRAAKLVRDWKDCPPEQQAWAERTLAKMAAIARKKRGKTGG